MAPSETGAAARTGIAAAAGGGIGGISAAMASVEAAASAVQIGHA